MKNRLGESLNLMLNLGMDIQYGQVSICNLAKYCITRNILERKYQVHSDDSRFRFSSMYSNPKVAIDKFILIYSHIKSKEIKN